MDLKWFHIVFINLAVAMSAGVGTWAVGADRLILAVVSLGLGIALIVYEGYFVGKTTGLH